MILERISASGVILLSILVGLAASGCTGVRKPGREGIRPEGWPLEDSSVVVSSRFGAPRGRTSHQGIDLAAPAGTPVRCTAPGFVLSAGRSGAFGRLVVVEHGSGWETRYAHLKRIRVRAGERVRRGQIVGTVGHSGNATGNHLHYEVRRNDRPVDPWPLMQNDRQ